MNFENQLLLMYPGWVYELPNYHLITTIYYVTPMGFLFFLVELFSLNISPLRGY